MEIEVSGHDMQRTTPVVGPPQDAASSNPADAAPNAPAAQPARPAPAASPAKDPNAQLKRLQAQRTYYLHSLEREQEAARSKSRAERRAASEVMALLRGTLGNIDKSIAALTPGGGTG